MFALSVYEWDRIHQDYFIVIPHNNHDTSVNWYLSRSSRMLLSIFDINITFAVCLRGKQATRFLMRRWRWRQNNYWALRGFTVFSPSYSLTLSLALVLSIKVLSINCSNRNFLLNLLRKKKMKELVENNGTMNLWKGHWRTTKICLHTFDEIFLSFCRFGIDASLTIMDGIWISKATVYPQILM